MSLRRGIRRGRIRTDASPLTLSVEELVGAAATLFATAMTELTREVRKCTISQQQTMEKSSEGDD
ncbi:hypothetical protein M514_02211 [Trichuris suis]|uniref:Uncharacterized protein n=1 Tax=Trichuris suis TaxID=68888 RepID=A0A085MIA8_9BILA|nr:hypothetical protein M513_02211 [Trichuris suis]KFD70057.1 hypothetical protein M514_02211 [Trichuris suis]